MAEAVCATCGAAVLPEARFCPNCGAAVAAEATAPADAVVATGGADAATARAGADSAGAAATAARGTAAAPAYAGFWIRFAALFIDSVLLSFITGVARGVLGLNRFAPGELTPFMFGTALFGSPLSLRVGAGALVGAVIAGVYYTVLIARSGQTIGAMAVGIRVVRVDGGLLSPGAALVRWLGHYLSQWALLIGYFWMLGDARKQTWHDKLAGSVVVLTAHERRAQRGENSPPTDRPSMSR